MKTKTIIFGFCLTLSWVGCGKKASEPAPDPGAAPVTLPAMTAWRQGDKPAAIDSFVKTEWTARPLFPSTSALSLNEEQFKDLSHADRESKSAEMMPEIDALKRLAASVAQAGRDAMTNGDTGQARKYFTSLKQCGSALDSPESLRLLQIVGQGIKKVAETELGKLGQ